MCGVCAHIEHAHTQAACLFIYTSQLCLPGSSSALVAMSSLSTQALFLLFFNLLSVGQRTQGGECCPGAHSAPSGGSPLCVCGAACFSWCLSCCQQPLHPLFPGDHPAPTSSASSASAEPSWAAGFFFWGRPGLIATTAHLPPRENISSSWLWGKEPGFPIPSSRASWSLCLFPLGSVRPRSVLWTLQLFLKDAGASRAGASLPPSSTASVSPACV